MYRKNAEKLLEFIKKSPSAFQAVEQMKKRLLKKGFTELSEKECWDIRPGGRYFTTRNHSALAAFSIPEEGADHFHILASHSDSPALKIKENPEINVEGMYVRLNVEPYGGMLMAPWFDRPLSVAGRVIAREKGEIRQILVDMNEDMALIPSLAIHMNREANNGYKYNAQKDLLPLYGLGDAKGSFMKRIAQAAGVKEKDILGHDLFLYPRTEGSIWGPEEEFVSAPRLDDVQCAFASLEGFSEGAKKKIPSVSTVCWTMRKLAAVPSRGQLLPF